MFGRCGEGTVVFIRGKYRGRSLDEIARIKPEYLQWMLRDDYFDDTRTIASEALGQASRRDSGGIEESGTTDERRAPTEDQAAPLPVVIVAPSPTICRRSKPSNIDRPLKRGLGHCIVRFRKVHPAIDPALSGDHRFPAKPEPLDPIDQQCGGFETEVAIPMQLRRGTLQGAIVPRNVTSLVLVKGVSRAWHRTTTPR
jgi:Exodeoxyribonuclease X-like C-terminal